MSSIISIASFLYLFSFVEYVNSISVAAGKTEKEHRELCSVTVSNEIQGRNNTPCVFPFIFEGVKYLEDESTNEIYNSSQQLVGEWNENGDDIIWKSNKFKKTHKLNRSTLNELD